MKKILAICLLFFFALFSLQAGKSQGVVEEFNKVEEYNKNVKLSDAAKKDDSRKEPAFRSKIYSSPQVSRI